MKKDIIQISISAGLFAAGIIVENAVSGTAGQITSLVLFILSYLAAGYKVLLSAGRNILRGKIFDENFLMAVASIGAFIIGQYPEGTAVMLFYTVGEAFQDYAVGRSRKSITDLMNIRPDYANLQADGELIKKDPSDIKPGDIIVVKPGEKVPLDGTIISGYTLLDTSALTGESVPRETGEGSEVLSGTVNLKSPITVKVTKEYGESAASRILNLVENASAKKSKSERFITKFAKYYTPIVVISAFLLAFVPPLISWAVKGAFDTAYLKSQVFAALNFLVVSCPCALVVSVPLAFFGGIGGSSRRGILVKGSVALEVLAKSEIMVMDKTGTLTKGVFNVCEVRTSGNANEQKIKMLAAYAENFSVHPVADALKKAYGKEIDASKIKDAEEIAGHGTKAVIDGKTVLAGNAKLMNMFGIKVPDEEFYGTAVYVAEDKKYLGLIIIADEVKSDSASAIREMKAAGIKKTVMLTGDKKAVAEKVAGELGIDEYRAELLPGGKVDEIEKLMGETSLGGKVVFVGDGINDAPVIARADASIAMGGLGSDAAIEAADAVIMTDEPSKIPVIIRIARKTVKIAQENIWVSLAVKAVVLGLSIFGYGNLWMAVFADVGVTMLAVLNSFRALSTGKEKNAALAEKKAVA